MRKVTITDYKIVIKELLKLIDALCQKNGIKYFVFYGTLLGAIRNNGFIPWDDDLDICMTRNDYEKFIKLFPLNNKQYEVLTMEDYKCYPSSFAKVIDNRIKIQIQNNYCYRCGAFVDVFPLDSVPDDVNMDILYKNFEEKRELVYSYSLPISSYFRIKTRKKIKFLFSFINYIKKHRYANNYRKDLLQFMVSFDAKDSNTYVDFSDKKGIVYKNEFETILKHQFEDISICIPNGYDSILRRLYGNYQELPPATERITTHSFKIYWNPKYNK